MAQRVQLNMVAGLFDALDFFGSFGPIIGLVLEVILSPITGIVGVVIFWVWFKHLGVNIFQGKIFKWTVLIMVLESLPLISAFSPGFVVLVNRAATIANAEAQGTV